MRRFVRADSTVDGGQRGLGVGCGTQACGPPDQLQSGSDRRCPSLGTISPRLPLLPGLLWVLSSTGPLLIGARRSRTRRPQHPPPTLATDAERETAS